MSKKLFFDVSTKQQANKTQMTYYFSSVHRHYYHEAMKMLICSEMTESSDTTDIITW